MSDRLDRIEAILEQVATQQQEAQQQISSNARAIEANSNAIAETRAILEQVAIQQQATQQQISSNARAIEANSNAIAEMRSALRQEVESMVEMITDLGEYVNQQAVQAERDRNQAAIDRAEFRSTVQGILDALTERFSGNGHGE